MPKQPRRLEVESITFSSGALRSRELPKTVYKGLWLKLSITHTNGVGPTITADSLMAVLSKINIVINGQDQLKSVPFRHIFYRNQYDFSIAPQSSLFTTNSVQGTSYVWAYLPFAMTRSLNPEDTVLDARKFQSLMLEANWGSSIGTNVTSLDSGTLKIYTDEYSNVDENFAGGRHEENVVSRNLDATGSRTLELEVGSNNQYRRLWIYTRNSSAALSNVQIDNLIVKSRAFNYDNINADALQQFNAWEFAQSPQTGLYVLDFTRDGKLTQRIDARNLSELIVDVNSLVSNGTMEIVKEKAIFA
jgi:hypothetical protein